MIKFNDRPRAHSLFDILTSLSLCHDIRVYILTRKEERNESRINEIYNTHGKNDKVQPQ